MMKKFLLLFGAVAVATALVVSGCGSDGTGLTGCESNLPCTVSTNIN